MEESEEFKIMKGFFWLIVSVLIAGFIAFLVDSATKIGIEQRKLDHQKWVIEKEYKNRTNKEEVK